MSAIGAPRPYQIRPRIISAHADYRSCDFVFPRTQSRTLRGTPGGHRLRPMRSWSEIGAYGAAAVVAATALMAMF